MPSIEMVLAGLDMNALCCDVVPLVQPIYWHLIQFILQSNGDLIVSYIIIGPQEVCLWPIKLYNSSV